MPFKVFFGAMPNWQRHISSATAIVLFCSLSISPVAAQSRESGCGVAPTTHQVLGHADQFLHGIEHAPRNAIRPENLKWELPIAATTGLLIAEADQAAANRIQSPSLIHTARRWSNLGLATEIVAAGATWGGRCIEHKPSLVDNGLTALTAIGAASTLDLALKLAFGYRPRGDKPNNFFALAVPLFASGIMGSIPSRIRECCGEAFLNSDMSRRSRSIRGYP